MTIICITEIYGGEEFLAADALAEAAANAHLPAVTGETAVQGFSRPSAVRLEGLQ